MWQNIINMCIYVYIYIYLLSMNTYICMVNIYMLVALRCMRAVLRTVPSFLNARDGGRLREHGVSVGGRDESLIWGFRCVCQIFLGWFGLRQFAAIDPVEEPAVQDRIHSQTSSQASPWDDQHRRAGMCVRGAQINKLSHSVTAPHFLLQSS